MPMHATHPHPPLKHPVAMDQTPDKRAHLVTTLFDSLGDSPELLTNVKESTAAEWRCEACGCLMALRCATPLSARRPAAGVCGGRVALQGVRRPNGAADTMWARGSVQSYGDACELCFLK